MKTKEDIFEALNETIRTLSEIKKLPKNSKRFRELNAFKSEVIARLKLTIYYLEKQLF